MNILNRTVGIILLLLLIAVLIIAAVVPYTLLERLIYTFQLAQDTLQSRWPLSYVVFLVVDIVVILLLIFLLWLELRPQGKKTVTVRTGSGTQAEVSTASVEQSLQQRIGAISDVLKVRPTVRGKRGAVDIMIDLETIPEIDIPAKTDEVSQAARDLIESRMGLKVGSIKVRVRQAAYGKAAPSSATVSPRLPSEPVAPSAPQPSPSDLPTEESEPFSKL